MGTNKKSHRANILDNLLAGVTPPKIETKEEVNIAKDSDFDKKITIKEEFKSLIPPLSADEYKKLEENIVADGCRDSLVLWDRETEYILIDGHNRYKICQENSVRFNVYLVKFPDADSAKDWMLNNQLGKRNVTDDTKSYLRGMQYAREKKKVGQNQFTIERNPDTPAKSTAEKLAEIHKVSEPTIIRDNKYAVTLNKITFENDELRWNILNKIISITKNAILLLADESDETLLEIGKKLAEGQTLAEIQKELTKKPVDNIEIHIKQTQKDINVFLTKAIKQKSILHLIEAEKILQKIRSEIEKKEN